MSMQKEVTIIIHKDNTSVKLSHKLNFFRYDSIMLNFRIKKYNFELAQYEEIIPLSAVANVEMPDSQDTVSTTITDQNLIQFHLAPKYTDQLGTYKIQLVVRDLDGCVSTLPHFEFEIHETINNEKLLVDDDGNVIIDDEIVPIGVYGNGFNRICDLDEIYGVDNDSYTIVTQEDKTYKVKIDNLGLADRLGDLDNLVTADKASLVGAINEIGRAQVDYVSLMRDISPQDRLYVQKIGQQSFRVAMPISADKTGVYYLNKQNNGYVSFNRATISDGVISETFVSYNKNYDKTTGQWTVSGEEHYTSVVGATMEASFTGTGIGFRYYSTPSSGIWSFVIDNDEDNPITISTYSVSQGEKEAIIATGLPFGDHRIVATFIGADPYNPPLNPPARCYASYHNAQDNQKTFIIYNASLEVKEQAEVIDNAIECQMNLQVTQQPIVKIDDKQVMEWNVDLTKPMERADKITIFQKGEVQDKANITSVHTITNKGINITMKIQALSDLQEPMILMNMLGMQTVTGTGIHVQDETYTNHHVLGYSTQGEDYVLAVRINGQPFKVQPAKVVEEITLKEGETIVVGIDCLFGTHEYAGEVF